ncbi:MAG: alpha/beta fold hydrolase [Solirubrobacterales bacterium]|nr:alpha/beta fold hydrolase [Solirubrobacterales bacterium]
MRRPRWLAGALGGALGFLLVLATASASSTPPWGRCGNPGLRALHAKCGYISVPLDYNAPHGPQIQLAVSIIPHTSRKYQGVVITDPGGPGGSGVALNPSVIGQLQADGYGHAAAEYDWVGFDSRGVGSSIPAISCDPQYFSPDRPSYIPSTSELLRTWLSRSQGYARDCASRTPLQTALLSHMTTLDTARDIESIRRALGQRRITYYGWSYGAYVGQVYATLFPSRVYRLILDSIPDPRTVWYQSNLDQDGALNRNENIWFGWLARYRGIYHLGATARTVRRTFYAAQSRLARDPAGGVVGPDEWNDIFIDPAYYQFTWVASARLFSNWVRHPDAKAARALISAYRAADSVGNDNEFAVYLSTGCTDAPWPTDWSRWSRDNRAIYARAPLWTWSNAWENAPCIYWPARPSRPVGITGRGIRSALLIDETLDGADPFAGSVEVRKLFPHSVLLAEPGGTTHAETPDGYTCVDGTIAAYLNTGRLPARLRHAEWDKTCPPPPVPVPPNG